MYILQVGGARKAGVPGGAADEVAPAPRAMNQSESRMRLRRCTGFKLRLGTSSQGRGGQPRVKDGEAAAGEEGAAGAAGPAA